MMGALESDTPAPDDTPPPLPYRRLNPPERTLLGPDLSNASPRARQGLIAVLEGANDPSFLAVLEEAVGRLRRLWRTENEDTFLIPGSEETALEAALLNTLQAGETAVVASSGFFGERLAAAAERCGAQVIRVVAPAGEAVSLAALRKAMNGPAVRLLAVLHGEGSTGVLQPLSGLGELAHAHDALLLVDSRWTISALEVPHDALGIDIGVAGSQKAISAYPGLGLITFSERAAAVHAARQGPVASPSLDLAQLRRFREDERAAQTLPAPIVYALTELLQLIDEQGLAYRASRLVNRRDALVAAFAELGLSVYARPEFRLPTVTAVNVPAAVDAAAIRQQLLSPYRIDIGGGLGELRGKVWRVGILGHSAQPTFLLALVTLLEIFLEEAGHSVGERGAAARTLLAQLD
ncbi:MAG: aminotransferase class V-fold PLP-dependent enzyme [Chloroflexi bacterium]|nr:aminotransferase class V-fold PLP-dependent enzyme [Chloroflexota bacterium]